MRFIFPLLFAIVVLTTTVVIFNVTIQRVYSYDPTLGITYNGSHYIATITTARTQVGGIPVGTVVAGGPVTVNRIVALAGGTAGYSCNPVDVLVPTVMTSDFNLYPPTGVTIALTVDSGTVYVHRPSGRPNQLYVYCLMRTTLGSFYYYNIVYEKVAEIGEYHIYAPAIRDNVDVAHACSKPADLPTYTIYYVYAREQRYDCAYRSWGTYTPPSTQSITLNPGVTLDGYKVYEFSGYTIILHRPYYPTSTGQVIIRPPS